MLSNKIMMVLVLALGGTAMAQDADPLGKSMQGAAPSGQPTGAVRVPEVPGAPVQQADVPQAAPAPAPAPVVVAPAPVPVGVPAPLPAGVPNAPAAQGVGPAGASPDAPDDSADISANYDATEQIYVNILQNQQQDTGQIDHRIAANQEIKGRYRPELSKNEEQMRRLQVDFMNRAFQLRQQKDAGQLSDEQFNRAIAAEQAKFERKKGAIVGDLQFYKDEMGQADVRLTELSSQKRTIEDRVARENAGKPKKKAPGEAVFDAFNGELEKLGAFHTSFTMDGEDCRQSVTFGKKDDAAKK